MASVRPNGQRERLASCQDRRAIWRKSHSESRIVSFLFAYRRLHLDQRLANFSRRLRYVDTGSLHRLDLLCGCSFASRDDGSRMTHAASRRRRLSGDEADHRFADLLPDEFGCCFLGAAADFADHDDSFGFRIVVEQPDGIDEIRSNDWVATDANRGRLPDATRAELVNRLIRQRPRARNDANVSFLVNMSWHDADLALAR